MSTKLLPRAQEPMKFTADLIYSETDFLSEFKVFEHAVVNHDIGGQSTAAHLQQAAIGYYLAGAGLAEPTSTNPADVLENWASPEPHLLTPSVVVYMERMLDVEAACAVIFDNSFGSKDFKFGLARNVGEVLQQSASSCQPPSFQDRKSVV